MTATHGGLRLHSLLAFNGCYSKQAVDYCQVFFHDKILTIYG